MKKNLLFFLLTFFCSALSFAQEWEQIYPLDDVAGFPGSNLAYDVKQTLDGGFILAGVAEAASGAIRRYIRLVKTDMQGNLEWSKVFKEGEVIDEEIRSIAVLPDGGYLLGGSLGYSSSSNVSAMYLLRTDAEGGVVWSRNDFDGFMTQRQYGASVTLSNDGHFLFVGSTQAVSNNKREILLVKINPEGNEIWEERYYQKNNNFVSAESIIEAANGDLLISGAALAKAMLLRTNAMGDSLWTETYINSKGSSAYDLVETANGDLILASSQSGFAGVNPDVLKTDANGIEEFNWLDPFWTSGTTLWGNAEAIDQTEDGAFVVTGFSTGLAPSGGETGYMTKIADDGTPLWSRSLSINYNAIGHAILALGDDCYAIAGTAEGQMFLTKLCGEGTNALGNLAQGKKAARLYPNPNAGDLIVEVNEEISLHTLQLTVWNTLGQKVIEVPVNRPNISVKTTHLPSGSYWYQLQNNGEESKILQTGKIVVQ